MTETHKNLYMIRKVLVANRGEIAIRVMRSCYEMGIRSVAVYSTADRLSRHVLFANEAECIGGAQSSDSYLNIDHILEAAHKHQVDAIHPGYGFLSENSEFARRCEAEGFVFIGPRPETMDLMGDKISARQTMIKAGVPVVPGTEEPLKSAEEAVEVARKIGFPVMLKASMGGGGKGMRLIEREEDVVEMYNAARGEAKSGFGDDTVYIEKFVEEPHHIEFQILGDKHGNVIHLYDRECSVQRRHQKVVEESPSPFLDYNLRMEMGAKAVAAAMDPIQPINITGMITIATPKADIAKAPKISQPTKLKTATISFPATLNKNPVNLNSNTIEIINMIKLNIFHHPSHLWETFFQNISFQFTFYKTHLFIHEIHNIQEV